MLAVTGWLIAARMESESVREMPRLLGMRWLFDLLEAWRVLLPCPTAPACFDRVPDEEDVAWADGPCLPPSG